MRTMFRKEAGRLGPAALLASLLVLVTFTPRQATAQFIPYYGKNKVKYDNFAWRIYRSPHFEVFYYPEFEQHLGRLVSYLESSYLKISTGLKHEMSRPIPVIFYKTHSEFEQTNLFPAFIPEGVAAFTEPVKNRMVLPIDEPPDQLQGLITHEMVHAFAFDLIPRGIGFGISQSPIPLWVDEGLADYFGTSEGVLVSDVHEDSTLGLEPGDVILDIDGREAIDPAQVRRILERFGLNVIEAADGSEALELAGRHRGPIHLLLSDVIMPRMNGRQLHLRLRRWQSSGP